jgi:hypothetical protein
VERCASAPAPRQHQRAGPRLLFGRGDLILALTSTACEARNSAALARPDRNAPSRVADCNGHLLRERAPQFGGALREVLVEPCQGDVLSQHRAGRLASRQLAVGFDVATLAAQIALLESGNSCMTPTRRMVMEVGGKAVRIRTVDRNIVEPNRSTGSGSWLEATPRSRAAVAAYWALASCGDRASATLSASAKESGAGLRGRSRWIGREHARADERRRRAKPVAAQSARQFE